MADTTAAATEHAEKPAPPKLLEGGQLVDHRDGRDVVLKLREVRTQFDDNIIHDNLDFDVFRGEIIGLVGGSGTGKSVLLRTIVGLNEHTKGTVEMLGVDTSTLHGQAERSMQARTGVQFQDGALFSSLSVTDNIIVPIREHIGLDEQLMRDIAALKVAMVGLPADTGDKKPSELSGGMRKRASLARALALDPELLFLDEPTAGLDPQSRIALWEILAELHGAGQTILLTTHYMEEADHLCDRVAIMDHGKILALDTPAGLKRSLGADTIVRIGSDGDLRKLATVMAAMEGARSAHVSEGGVLLYLSGPVSFTLPRIFSLAAANGFPVTDVSVTEPTLEAVFITLTGKELRD